MTSKTATRRAANLYCTPFYQDLRKIGVGAQSAAIATRRHWAFIADLSARVRADKKRARAAKKGWKTRRKQKN